MQTEKNSIFRKLLNPFKGDRAIWFIFTLLAIISLISVYSSIGLTALRSMGTTPEKAFFKHLIYVITTFGFVALLSNFDYRKFSKMSWWGYILCIALLIMAMIVGSGNAAGSGRSRWIGGFQPSELAKIVMIVFLARLIAQERENLKEWVTLRNIVIAILILLALIAPENLSTAIIIFVVCFAMLRIAPINVRYWRRTLLGIIAFSLLLAFVGSKMELPQLARLGTWTNRIDNWLHYDPDELTQENMARMAVASGKFIGVGVGSTIQARLMTQANNDLIYAIIIEETGMVGGIVVFILYALLYIQCIRIAWRCRGPFGRMCVVGLGTLIFLQAAIHMSVAVGALPVTGQTLPFISSGGSAYLCMGLALGIIQSIAQDTKPTKPTNKKKHNQQPNNDPQPIETT